MTSLLWPIEGGKQAWPIYRDEAQHIAGGEKAGVDLANQEGLACLAPADWECVLGTGNDPAHDESSFHAGNVVVIQCGSLRFHCCHLQSLDVAIGQTGNAGDTIGLVGSTGSVWDSSGGFQTVEAAHLHLWVEEWTPAGWSRVQDIGALFADEGTGGDSAIDKTAIENALNVLNGWVHLGRKIPKKGIRECDDALGAIRTAVGL